jgi:MinD-like ATPase involved in chromosome partitioning or flagellar assembly
MDKRFAGRSWFRFYEALAEGKSIRGVRNMDEGINWILRSPEEGRITLAFEQKLRLISHARSDVILCDLSGESAPDYELLHSMDQLIAVVDPMPSKMLEGYQTLCNIKMLETEKEGMIFVINKMNRGVNRRQMLDFLKIRKPVFLPLVSPESVYTAEYNCKIPYTLGEVKNALQGSIEEIVTALVF